jgi:pectin methylesterase-like acyl-CoA thioesterase
MRRSDQTSRFGRIAAIATLAASAALFVTALLGIASIDPNADAAAPAPRDVPAEQQQLVPPPHSISLAPTGGRDDCPWEPHETADTL